MRNLIKSHHFYRHMAGVIYILYIVVFLVGVALGQFNLLHEPPPTTSFVLNPLHFLYIWHEPATGPHLRKAFLLGSKTSGSQNKNIGSPKQ